MGYIFDIQRFSVHDGPGIRTNVFFKGCPLKCIWCHNPESQSKQADIGYYSDKCLACGACASVCKLHTVSDGKHDYNRSECVKCGKCTEICPTNALTFFGREATAEEIIAEVMKDKTFYQTSGGGLTVSGGEPLYQPEFLKELLTLAKENRLHTCIETCGFASKETVKAIAPLTDIFLFDYKASDERSHMELTGAPLKPIVDNLIMLDKMGIKTVLRCPLIPNANLTEEHLDGIAKLAASLDNLIEVNVMAYHALGSGKYSALEKNNALSDQPSMTGAEKEELIDKISEKIKKLTDKNITVC